MLEIIYKALQDAGIKVYLGTLHTGTCMDPYCVLYEGQPEFGKSVVKRHILIDMLVSHAKPELLPEQLQTVTDAMNALGHRPVTTSPTTVLDDYKAVAATMDFVALCGIDN